MKNKSHKPQQKRNLAMHSKKTGAIILFLLGLLIVGSSLFFYLAINESNLIQNNEERFRALSCNDMKLEINQLGLDVEPWQLTSLSDKSDC